MLVVIGVLAILIGLMLPVLVSARASARRTACQNNLHQIGAAFMLYLHRNSECFPIAQDPVSTSPYYWLWMGRGWRPVLSRCVSGEDRIFWCPADQRAVEKYSSTSYAYSMSFYHSPEQINTMTTAARTYSNPVPSVAQHLARVRTPEKKVLVAEWYSNHATAADDAGWWTWEGSRNYLFVDGHVEYREARTIRSANDGWPDPNLTTDGMLGADVD